MDTNETSQKDLESAMLPFVMRELVDIVMKKKDADIRRCVILHIFFPTI